jgi:hypothetical protein
MTLSLGAVTAYKKDKQPKSQVDPLLWANTHRQILGQPAG